MQDQLPPDSEQQQTPDVPTGADATIPTPSLEEAVDVLFDDPEARRNIVGLFDLLLKIDRRLNPHEYENHD